MGNDETPKHIKELEKKKDQIDKIIETANIHYSQAYTSQADKHLFDKEKGVYDHDRLKNKKVREKMAGGIADYLIEKAKEHFKSDAKDEMTENRLLKAYAGVTREQIMEQIEEFQHDYTSEQHEDTKKRFMKKVREDVGPLAHAHLDDSHIDDIVKATPGAKNAVDTKKMQLNDAIMVYNLGREHGNVTPELIKNTYRSAGQTSPIYLKKKKKDKKAN